MKHSNRPHSRISRKTILRVIRILLWLYLLCFVIAALHYGRRIFISETFVIPSSSMSPTLNPGDRVRVSKLLFGPRLYRSFEFGQGKPLRSIRLPGIREIRPGDVIVFNFPFGYGDWSKIEFRINNVYCKRVLGCPGDRIGIVGGHCWNDRILRPVGLCAMQEKLRKTDRSELDATFRLNAIPLAVPDRWDVIDLGPLRVPKAGMTVRLDGFTAELYRLAIEYETGSKLSVREDGTISIGSEQVTAYTFSGNWYFALGDNSIDSQDSRYFGFIPETFIVGIVPGV